LVQASPKRRSPRRQSPWRPDIWRRARECGRFAERKSPSGKKETVEMERHWIRVAAAVVIVAGTSAPQATAQLAPYRLAQQQSAAPAPRTAAAPQAVAPVATQPLYTPYRPQVHQQPAARPGTLGVARAETAMTTGQPIARVAAAPQYPRVANNNPQVQSTYPTVTYPQTAANYPTTPDYPQTTATYPQAAPMYPETTSTYPQTTPPYPESPEAYTPAGTQYAQSPTPYRPGVTPYAPYATYANTQQAEELPDNGDDDSLPPPSRNGEPMNGDSANGYGTNGYGVDSVNGASANGVHTDGAHVNGAANGAANGRSMLNSNGATTHVENGHNGYPATSYPYGYGDVGANCDEHDDWGLASYIDNPHHDSNWFGGVYYLFMTRDDSDHRRLTAMFNTPAGGYPYYPAAEWTVLSSSHVDHDYRSGVEIRFGSTFASGGHDECDSACGTPYGYGYGYDNSHHSCDIHEYAWEFGAWILDDDLNTAEVIDSIPTDTDRIYGMKNFAGLSYNGRDVNDWYDYQMPVTDPAAPGATDVRILAQRVRSSFRAQNVELNFLRLPLCGMDTCGTGHLAGDHHGYGATDCAPDYGSSFSMTTLCGVRYLRFDDDFEYATMWALDAGGVLTPPAYTPWDGEGELVYDIEVDNELLGFQLGANMNYCISCRCNVFWNSSFGVYNNHIEVYQRVFGEFGPASWTQTGADAVISADKDDIAFAGEMLIGTSYNFTYNVRGVLAYRAVAVSGVGLSVDQIPENFANEADVALVDSNGSLLIHGVQIGTEWRY
jgi:hypothetical protein